MKKLSKSVIKEVRSKQAADLLESSPDLRVDDIASVMNVRENAARNYISRGMEIKEESRKFGKGVDPDSLD